MAMTFEIGIVNADTPSGKLYAYPESALTALARSSKNLALTAVTDEAMAAQPPLISRRAFQGSVLFASLALIAGVPRAALASRQTFEATLKTLFGDRGMAEGRVTLDVPQIAENGLVVPVGIEVESPMTDADYVRAVHLFAKNNPVPHVGTYRFTPASGRAAVTTRIRLAQTQDVVAVAEMSDGALFTATAQVKVTIGGCG